MGLVPEPVWRAVPGSNKCGSETILAQACSVLTDPVNSVQGKAWN